MWILPKKIQSLTSVSVLDTKESEKDLEEFCQMSEKSLMWRSKPSLLRTWLTRWKRNNWMQHLSIRTLKSSHTKSFVDKWTSYLEDSLANHSLKLELEKLQRTQDTSSLTSQKESESANLELFSSKMSKESSQQKPQMENQFSNMSSEHWKDWVTEQRREYSQRVKSASHIKEKESSSWDTPRVGGVDESWKTAEARGRTSNLYAQMDKVINYPTPSVAGCVEGGVAKNVEMNEKGFSATRENGTKYGAKLRDAVIHQASKQWLTPTGVDIERTPEGMEKRKKYRESIGRKYVEGCLTEQVKNWGTPREAMSRDKMTDSGKHKLGEQVQGMHNNQDSQRDLMKNNTNGKPLVSLKLNPDWVEQLMGLPIGWTDFDFSEME